MVQLIFWSGIFAALVVALIVSARSELRREITPETRAEDARREAEEQWPYGGERLRCSRDSRS
jgi:hypothetical protein